MDSSDDDLPLAARVKVVAPAAPPQPADPASDSSDEDELPLAKRAAILNGKPRPAADDVPLVQRKAELAGKSAPKPSANANPKPKPAAKPKPAPEKSLKRKANNNSSSQPAKKRKPKVEKAEDKETKWNTLVHSGVLFPPEYEPHGVKMLYDGVPVDLTPAQEEVATFFAVMKETDYMKKPQFLKNFWEGFKEVLGKNHIIKSLDKCDFTPMFEYHMAERERKKSLSKEEKERLKKQKDEAEAKYKTALVDGRVEQVGNFRVEPPGLFRGRGEHPKMGKLKRRIYPRDITINIGRDAPVPEHPYPGQHWKEVRHDNTVTWLAFWNDPVSTKDFKYVWLAANSVFKSESDLAKYEKARKLKEYIVDIRKTYEKEWESPDRKIRQMATALYFIDKLALRAGHEKDEDEADTVGCCTLKVENVSCLDNSQVKFDFLGKDSIRYENVVEVHPKVYSNLKLFMKQNADGSKKRPDSQMFETFDAQHLNQKLKDLMDGLSVKVFRTYNASITLDRLLHDSAARYTGNESVDNLKADYDRANKEVAILCNHQRSVPKTHVGQMEKMQEKINVVQAELADLEAELALAERGKANEAGKKLSPEAVQQRVNRKQEQLRKLQLARNVKDDLKTVALGTSKINYMDPRITIAWCKCNDVPIEKVFNKSLLTKFFWSMDVEPEFRF